MKTAVNKNKGNNHSQKTYFSAKKENVFRNKRYIYIETDDTSRNLKLYLSYKLKVQAIETYKDKSGTVDV